MSNLNNQLFKTYINRDQGDLYPRHEALRTVAVRDTDGEWLVMHRGDWVGADGYAFDSSGDRTEDGKPLGSVEYAKMAGWLDYIDKHGFGINTITPCVYVDFSEKLYHIALPHIKQSRVEISLDREGHESGEAHGVPYPAQSSVVPVIEDQELIIAHGVTPEIYDALADGTVTRWWDDMGSSLPAQELVLDVDEWDEDTGEAVFKWELKEN